jgi:hypothetical protein
MFRTGKAISLWCKWRCTASGGGTKTQSEDLLQAYAEVQGVSGALAHEAEKVQGKLNDAQQVLLFPILARLIRRGELGGATRRTAQRDEFDAEKQRLIAHLSSEEGGRLLLASDGAVEIAHEALITRWPWLRTEGQKFASDIDELARLMDKARAWAKEAIDDRPKYLATGAELETFSALAARRKDWLSNKEREFADASNKAHEAEEKRKADEAARLKRQVFLSGMLAIAAVIALLVVGVIKDLERSTREARKNFSSALTALAFAELEQRPVNAAKLALAAWPRQAAMDLPKREVTLNAVSRSLAGLHERLRISDAHSPVAFSPDGKLVLAGSRDNTARLWDAATGREIRVFKGHENRVTSVAFSPDGARVLTGSAEKTARLWDISAIPKGSIFDIACARLLDRDLSGLGKEYGLDLSLEAPSARRTQAAILPRLCPTRNKGHLHPIDSGLIRLPLPIFRNRRLALPNRWDGKLSVTVISAAMPNDRYPRLCENAC